MSDSPDFAELPAALVEELLSQTASVGDQLLNSFGRIKADREKFREGMQTITKNDSFYGYPQLPTTCGIDGSYGVERLLSTDLAAAAAVAVEGLTPPSEKRHWDQPHHSSFVASEKHHADTATILRAVMLGRELMLATQAPHDLVMLDMTLTLPIIYFNQALTQVNETSDSLGLKCTEEFIAHACDYLDSYKTILTSKRSDKNFVGLPKYSTRREICTKMNWSSSYDDRGILTMLLKGGELTIPVPLEQPEKEWHLNTSSISSPGNPMAKELGKEILDALMNVFVLYYKPHDWLPALRVEVSKDIATNGHRLAVVLQGLKHQCATAGMFEPFPLYLADRTVKALARSLPAFRQVATQRIAEKYEGDIGEVFFAMHGYRSDSGGG
jgi:hypothetical protein